MADVWCIASTPLGEVYLAASEAGVHGLWFTDGRYVPAMTGEQVEPENPLFGEVRDWLTAYFAGQRPEVSQVRLALRGTAFQRQVWQQMLQIPYGETTTYGSIAKALGKPKAAQAVGAAVAHNPISLLIPCHRVLGADGSLTGYAGGLWRKEKLLALERGT